MVDTSLLQFIALEFVDLSQNRIANVSNLIPWALDRSAIELRRYDRYIQHSFGQNSGQAASIVGTQSQTGSGTGLGQSGPGAAPGQLASAATSATYTEKVAVQVYRNDFTGSFGRAKWFLVPELTKIPDLKETILAVSRCAPPVPPLARSTFLEQTPCHPTFKSTNTVLYTTVHCTVLYVQHSSTV